MNPPWVTDGSRDPDAGRGLEQCRGLGLDRVLVTCAIDNEPSRRVILANGGEPDGQRDGEDRFWISLGRGHHS